MRIFRLALLPALALVACKAEQPTPQGDQSASATPSATLAAASERASPAPAQPSCAAVRLDLSPSRFAEGRAAFADGKPGRTRLSDNFAQAYEAACAAGWLAKKPLIDPRAARQDTLFVANAPEANEAAIYFDDEGGAREMVIEGPFVDGEGHVQVPGVGAIKEAIYCYAVGATEKEQEASGRCLVD
jgi:hypothetical protein